MWWLGCLEDSILICQLQNTKVCYSEMITANDACSYGNFESPWLYCTCSNPHTCIHIHIYMLVTLLFFDCGIFLWMNNTYYNAYPLHPFNALCIYFRYSKIFVKQYLSNKQHYIDIKTVKVSRKELIRNNGMGDWYMYIYLYYVGV